MGWNTKYTGSQIDTALERGQNLRVVNNGWIRLESSNSAPTNLDNLKNPGNYITSYWINGPDFGDDTITPINISNVLINGSIYQFVTAGVLSFNRVTVNAESQYGEWSVDQSDGAVTTGPSAPAVPIEGKTIWLDTENATAPELKIYINGVWVSVIPEDSMLTNIYDPQGKKTDIFAYIDNEIAKISDGSIKDVDDHIADTSVHVTTSEKTKIANSASQADVNTASNTLKTSLETKVDEEISAQVSKIEGLSKSASNVSNELSSHSKDTLIHPSAEKQAEWDGKATGNHTHDLDGRVTIQPENIEGIIPSEKLPYDVKERVYIVNSEDELYSLQKNPIHNGDTICVESENASDWYFVINDEYLGIEGKDNWKDVQVSSNHEQWICACYGGDKYVVIPYQSNIFVYSFDGITWTKGTISSSSREWVSVCYGNGKFVAIARSTTKFAYSSNGINWTESDMPSRSWSSICYGNGKYVAVARNTNIFAYSTDGISWEESTISSTNRSWSSVCYGNGKYVAVANSTSIFAYSNDGITWYEGTIGPETMNWHCVCYGNGKFVALTSGESTSRVAYSSNGISWIELDANNEYREWQVICYGNGKYVAVDYISSTYIESADGITWTEDSISNSYREWVSVCYGNGKFVAVAPGTTLSVGSLLYNSAKAFKKFATSNTDWSNVINTPTTLAGYGITDAVTKEEFAAVETEVAQISSTIPSTVDLSNTAEAHTVYTAAVNDLSELDAAIVAMDDVIAKVESIAK